jgi:hypothetical protein
MPKGGCKKELPLREGVCMRTKENMESWKKLEEYH